MIHLICAANMHAVSALAPQAMTPCDTKALRCRLLPTFRSSHVETAGSQHLPPGVVWQTGGGVEV